MQKHPVPQEDSGTDRAGSNILPLTLAAGTMCRLPFFSSGAEIERIRYEQAEKKDQRASMA